MEGENLRGVGQRRANESHRVIARVRGRSLGVLHVGFDEFEGEPAESREKRERERGWASGVEVLVRQQLSSGEAVREVRGAFAKAFLAFGSPALCFISF